MTTITLLYLIELHLLEYRRRMLEYLRAFQVQRQASFLVRPRLEMYTSPEDPLGYADTSITDDMITHVYSEFSGQSRRRESEEYLCTLTGESMVLTMDVNQSEHLGHKTQRPHYGNLTMIGPFGCR